MLWSVEPPVQITLKYIWFSDSWLSWILDSFLISDYWVHFDHFCDYRSFIIFTWYDQANTCLIPFYKRSHVARTNLSQNSGQKFPPCPESQTALLCLPTSQCVVTGETEPCGHSSPWPGPGNSSLQGYAGGFCQSTSGIAQLTCPRHCFLFDTPPSFKSS